MYSIPDEFASELEDMFHGRFRLRWSEKRACFMLEQKVQTGQLLAPPPIDPDAPDHFDTYSDEWIRFRDGYFLTMEIRPGDRMPCPVCGLEVKVPILETRESICFNCVLQGRDGKYKAAYYPLNHLLLQHIRDIDPYFDTIHNIRKRLEARDRERIARITREQVEKADAVVLDNKNQIEDNPMVGFGSPTKQHTWQRFAEGSKYLYED